jgi:signal transduction histidine kinase
MRIIHREGGTPMGEGLTVLRVGNAGEGSGADIIDVNDVAAALTTLEERSVDGVFLPAERASTAVGILREHHPDVPIVVVGQASDGAPSERRERVLRTATEDGALASLTELRSERDAESALREHRGLRRAVGRIAAETAGHEEPEVVETALEHLLSTERFRFGFEAERRGDGSILGLPGTDALEFQLTDADAAIDSALAGTETAVIADSDPPAIVVPIGDGSGLVLFTADASTSGPGERSVLEDLATLLRSRREQAGSESTRKAAETGNQESEAASPDTATAQADATGESDILVEMLAHELRSPLDLGRGRLEMAVEEGEEEDIERAIETFDRIEDVVSAGVALARRETDDEAQIDLAERARSIWADTATAEASLEVDDAAGIEPIEADPALFDRLLSNLFRNAVKHGTPDSASGDSGEHGEEELTVRVGTLENGSGFFVSDDGQGIDPADRDRILEPGVSLGENGTGYGLAIVDRVGAAHGWDVSVGESADGGARFEILTE